VLTTRVPADQIIGKAGNSHTREDAAPAKAGQESSCWFTILGREVSTCPSQQWLFLGRAADRVQGIIESGIVSANAPNESLVLYTDLWSYGASSNADNHCRKRAVGGCITTKGAERPLEAPQAILLAAGARARMWPALKGRQVHCHCLSNRRRGLMITGASAANPGPLLSLSRLCRMSASTPGYNCDESFQSSTTSHPQLDRKLQHPQRDRSIFDFSV
jgi:hypothetical protein